MSAAGGAAGGGRAPLPRRVFLDVDIGGHRAAHALAVEFVAKNSLKYGLSSSVLAELGGSERARLQELFENDFAFSSRGAIALEPAAERVEIELFGAAAPLAAENFRALCVGDRGKAKGSSVPLCFRGSRLHRLVPGSFVQGGDFVMGNGAGGESVYGGVFKDEPAGLKIPLDARGLVACSNTGKHSNGSQFFITFGPLPKLNGKHTVFGRVVSGHSVLDAIEAVPCADEKPRAEIVIADCGAMP